jgi:hypothetical protein
LPLRWEQRLKQIEAVNLLEAEEALIEHLSAKSGALIGLKLILREIGARFAYHRGAPESALRVGGFRVRDRSTGELIEPSQRERELLGVHALASVSFAIV